MANGGRTAPPARRSRMNRPRHGMTGSREHRSWRLMRTRCNNSKRQHYKYYGGRGIKVCKRWMKFANFLTDMGRCPPNHSLDRKNNDGNYCKSNCRWATRIEQRNNRRDTRWITHDGRTQTMKQWSLETNLKLGTLSKRLNEGWPINRALTQPT
jgi:hypothetical protein